MAEAAQTSLCCRGLEHGNGLYRVDPELRGKAFTAMVDFFIRRPIFATVSALLMLLIGGICAFLLPIAQYPQIAPPQVLVTTTYTGADALSVARTVTTPIEQQINGTKGLIYYSSDSTSNGVSSIVATFDVGFSQDLAAVDIQNKVQTAQAQLPPEVKQYGVTIKKSSTDMVCVVNLISPDGRYDATFLDNYGQIYVADVLKRISGISDANVLGRKYAMRIWINPDRMANMKIAPTEVITAIQQENVQAAAGKIGGRPVPTGQDFELPITVKGRLEKATEFEEIVVRRNDDGSIVRVRDIARVELSSENFETASYIDGKPAGGILIYQYADANALAIIDQVRAEMNRLKKSFPEGLDYTIVYNTTEYVHENISEVEHTLVESFALVMVVVFIFLQGFRATIIPMLAIPVSLVATFAVMAAFGFSINSLTLCGLVLAIGLVVDDAIIVVENVEKFLHRGLRPLAATRAAMAEITTPIVTITLVLAAVFVPVAFMPGMTGRLYNQFAMTIVFSFVFSAFNSLTFSPAMARLFLKPKSGPTRFFLFRWFNAGLRWIENSYDSVLDLTARRWWTIVGPSLLLLVLTGWLLATRPKSFIPTEDQGYLIVVVQTPDGTSGGATQGVLMRVEELCRGVKGVRHTVMLEGLNVITSANQSNCGVVFLPLEEWKERTTPELRAVGLAATIQSKLSAQVRDAAVMVIQPPPIRGLSATGGFELMVEDRSGNGTASLQRVLDRFQDEARKRPELAGVFSTFSARVPQLKFDIDRTKARRLDVPISDLFAVLQANLGGYYVNDFDLYGKVWKVMVQAEGSVRTKPEDIKNLYVLNRKGERVHLSSLGEVRYTLGPIDVPHYNLYAAAKINGGPAPGYSSGQALAAMEQVAAKVLPEGFGHEWTGTTLQEQKTGNQATYIFALSVVCVFLFMAALYESWIRPMVIILTVPLAMFGAVVGLWLYDMPLDVFGQIGLVMLIGLETKNAILIVEFGVEMRQKHGMGIIESAKAASRERLRPILMTSFAFVMGVLPMARATGAGAYSRNSLGIVIAFGIAVSTVLGRFVIPVYYVLGERLIDYFSSSRGDENESAVHDLDRVSGEERPTLSRHGTAPAMVSRGDSPSRNHAGQVMMVAD
jgi:hydrophobe/amphiphile efflux-1 (HAE1) family protein